MTNLKLMVWFKTAHTDYFYFINVKTFHYYINHLYDIKNLSYVASIFFLNFRLIDALFALKRF